MLLWFNLTMPNRASWNGKWSGDNSLNARVMKVNKSDIDAELLNKILSQRDFYYRWDDGWTACVSVTKIDSKEAIKIRKNTKGFCGYDWMIKSILKCGEIKKPE